MKTKILTFVSVLFFLSGCSNIFINDNVLRVYSNRHYGIDRDLIIEFEKKTGIEVELLELEANEIINRLKEDNSSTVTDLVLFDGTQYIAKMNELDVLKDVAYESGVLEKYQGSNWIGFTREARFISSLKRANFVIESYDNLASSKYRNTINIGSSKQANNQALVASFLQIHGEEYTKKWLAGFVANFVEDPAKNDRLQVKKIINGSGKVTLVNSYSLANAFKSFDESNNALDEQLQIASLSAIPTNLSWVGKVSDNEYADLFIKYLVSKDVQSMYAVSGEYPVNSGVNPNAYLDAHVPKYEEQNLNFEKLGTYMDKAYALMLEAGWE